MIFEVDLVRRIEASAARVTVAHVDAFARQAPGDPARSAPFGNGALVAFGPGRYVNRAIGVSLDDIGDAGLDELEAFYAAAGLPPSLEVATWAPPALLARLAERRCIVSWFRNIYACGLDDHGFAAHPAMSVREVDDASLDEWFGVIRAGHAVESAAAATVSDEFARAAHAVPGATDYLADLDGRAVGCASLTRDEGIGWLGGATTLPASRQRGVQGALVRHRMAVARRDGCDLAVATAMPAGGSARNLARLGFTLAYTQAVMTRVAA